MARMTRPGSQIVWGLGFRVACYREPLWGLLGAKPGIETTAHMRGCLKVDKSTMN